MRIPRHLWITALALAVGVVAGYVAHGRAAPAAGPATGTAKYYTCEKHGHIHEGPGTCPVCGEPLKPVEVMPTRETKEERKIKYWRSPMDPTFVSKEPGKDNMGMDLVPVYEGEAEAKAGVIPVEPEVVLEMGIRTAKLEHGELRRRIRTVGNVDYNEEFLGTVTTKLDGWVDHLYVDTTGQKVDLGDPLFDIYSKELDAAQVAFLDSLKDPRLTSADVSAAERARAAALLESARQRLEYWEIPKDQIDEIAKEDHVRHTVTIRSRFRGIVTHKNAVEGRYFKAGEPLFEIADLATVWVYARIYEYERPWVKEGQEATIALSYVPGQVYRGRVEYIYPYLNEKTRDITVRLRFDNPDGALLPGMYADVTMDCSLGTHALLVPESAVLDTGVRKIVFVALGGGRFEARDVRVGVHAADGMWEVLDGLRTGEEVVVSGQFMLDAESKVREAIRKFLEAGQHPEGATDAHPPGHAGH